MSARVLLEKRAIFLQKLAYEVLTNPKVRLSALENVVGDPSLFDRDMSTLVSILYSHNNLVSESLPVTENPVHLLDQLRSGLESRGFKLPSFRKRYDWVKNTSGGSFENNDPGFSGGEAQALDKPLRRLREKMYELRLHDSEHIRDNLGRVVTQHTGAELVRLVEDLISAVKKTATEGAHYEVGNDEARAGTQQTEFLNKRYDEVASLFNRSTGTAAEGPRISLYHLHSPSVDGERWYALAESDVPALVRAVTGVRPDWKMEDNTKYEYPANILTTPESYQINLVFDESNVGGGTPGTWTHVLKRIQEKTHGVVSGSLEGSKATLISTDRKKLERAAQRLEELFQAQAGLVRVGRGAEQYEAEQAALESVSQPGENDTSIVRLVRLPFAPDQIDDAFPSVELKEDEFIGKHIARLTLELIRKSRFSGFVEFDDKYRMIILWANAPGDDQQDENGVSFRDHLVMILSSKKSSFAAAMGQTPEVMKTKTGAALYFPKPASLPRVIKARSDIEKAIENVNSLIDKMEQRVSLSRSFNRSIDDDELPTTLEEAV